MDFPVWSSIVVLVVVELGLLIWLLPPAFRWFDKTYTRWRNFPLEEVKETADWGYLFLHHAFALLVAVP